MVHFTKAAVVTTIAIIPVLSVPLPQFGLDVELTTREPLPPGALIRTATRFFRSLGPTKSVLTKVANHPRTPIVALGVVGVGGAMMPTQDQSQQVSAREVDELDARGYDTHLHLRENDDLGVRDLSKSLEARDNTYTLAAREFADAFESEVRRELEARQLTESLIDGLD